MARIFISHSSQNNAAAIALRDWLVAGGWDDLFLDLDPERGIVAGERWERALNEAADRCEAVVFLVSRAWLASVWCRKELHLADKLNKRLFGVLIEDMLTSEVPDEIRQHFQLVSLASGRDHEMFRAQLADGHEKHVTFSRSGLVRLKAGLTKAGLDPRFFAWPPEKDPDRSPYRGLNPLEAEDAGIFFGREAPTIKVLDELRGLNDAAPPHLYVILGASGAGKSSFLRAGLLPRLQRDERHFLPLPVVRPERAALTGETGFVRCLDAAVQRAGLGRERAEVKAAVKAGAHQVRALLEELAEQACPPTMADEGRPRRPKLVLPIDQAEELFLSEGAEEARAFLELIRSLTLDPASNLIALFTIRSDSFEELQTAKELGGINAQTFSLPPLARGAYQTVIEGPAARFRSTGRRLTIEPALTAALLADIEAGGGKDALPLLAFTLERLYLDHGRDGELELSEYLETGTKGIGGIKGSIEAAVEQALKNADRDDAVPRDRAWRLALLRRALIPWLAGIDPETGSPRRRVARLSEIPEEARPLVNYLVAVRLLSTDISPQSGERTVEPAHEALLRQWGLLEGWLKEESAPLAILDGVKRAAGEWEANARNEDWLAHGAGRLEDAEAVRARDDFAGMIGVSERAYLEACRTAETARREKALMETRRRLLLQRRLIFVSSAAALVFAVLGVFAALQWDRAEAEWDRAEDEANRAEQNLKAAKETIEVLIFDVAQGLRNNAGMPTASVRRVLEPVQDTIDGLARSVPDDVDLQHSRAVMHVEFANTYRAAGDHVAALVASKEALAIRRRIAEQHPDDSYWQHALSLSLSQLGDLEFDADNSAAAKAAYNEALAIHRRLAEQNPGMGVVQRSWSATLERIGNVEFQAGNFEAASAAYKEGLAIIRRLAALTPQDMELQRDLSLLQVKVAVAAQSAGGDTAGALAAQKESLAAIRRLSALDPDNTQVLRDLAFSLGAVGRAERLAGNTAAALAANEESLEIARRLTDRDPDNIEWQQDLVVRLYFVAEMSAATGSTRTNLINEALDLLMDLDERGIVVNEFVSSVEGKLKAMLTDPQ